MKEPIIKPKYNKMLIALGVVEEEIFQLGEDKEYYFRFKDKQLEFNTSGENTDWETCSSGYWKKLMTDELKIKKFPTLETNIEILIKKYPNEFLEREKVRKLVAYLKDNYSDNGIKELITLIMNATEADKDTYQYKYLKRLEREYLQINEEELQTMANILNYIRYKRKIEEWCKRFEKKDTKK